MPEPLQPPATVNPARPGTQTELTAYLASTIGNDVEQMMENIGWDSDLGQRALAAPPADPATAASTTGAEPAPTATPAPKAADAPAAPIADPANPEFDWESLRDPQTGLIGRKWKTPETATQGIHSLMKMANAALERATTAEQRVATLESQPRPAVTQPQALETVPQDGPRPLPADLSTKRDQVLSTLREKYELEPEDLNALLGLATDQARLTAESVISQSAQQQKADRDAWAVCDTYMAGHYPQSLEHVDEIKLYVETDPQTKADVAQMLAADNRVGAMRTAWLAYQAAHLSGAHAPPATATLENDPAVVEERRLLAAGQVRQEEVNQARIDAGLISTSASGVHEAAPVGPSEEEMASATGLYRAGIKEPLLRLAFGKDLKGPLFD